MDDDRGGVDTYAVALDRLSYLVTELGVQAMESFKYASAALFDSLPEVTNSALATSAVGATMAADIHQNAVRLLARWSPNGDSLRRLVELQRAAAECGRIAEHARHVAECARFLAGNAEVELSRQTPVAARLLAGLVHQGYIALRGCLILLTTRDHALARRIMAEDEEMDRLFSALRAILERSVVSQPQRATTLHTLAYAASELRQIGSRVVAICNDRLE